MKILVADKTTEGQAELAARIQALGPTDIEALNISVNLSNPDRCSDRIADFDVLIIGSKMGEQAAELARSARLVREDIHVLMFVSDEAYQAGAFRFARASKVRKIFSDSCDRLDLLQELVNIHGELCEGGRVHSGKFVVIAQAKGGVGATTLCASLAEVCNAYEQKTLLWDGDIESRDLTRALMADGDNARAITDFISGSRHITREELRDALSLLGEHVSLLPPPHTIAAAFDLVGRTDSIQLAERIVSLARVSFQNIIFDAAGRLSPLTGMLMRAADEVIIVIDDSLLGMSALDAYLEGMLPLLSHRDNLHLLCNGTRMSPSEIRATVDADERLKQESWMLPALPFDGAAAKWAGSGKTLFSLGQRQTRQILLELAHTTGLIHEATLEEAAAVTHKRQRAKTAKAPRAQRTEGLMSKVMNFSTLA